MTHEELIEVLARYEKLGWVVLALPPKIAEGVLDAPATQQTALELSARLKSYERELGRPAGS